MAADLLCCLLLVISLSFMIYHPPQNHPTANACCGGQHANETPTSVSWPRTAAPVRFLPARSTFLRVAQPGGHASGRPPIKCRCRWNTLCPALSPLLVTRRKSSSPSCLAMAEAATIRWPRVAACSGVAAPRPVSPSRCAAEGGAAWPLKWTSARHPLGGRRRRRGAARGSVERGEARAAGSERARCCGMIRSPPAWG